MPRRSLPVWTRSIVRAPRLLGADVAVESARRGRRSRPERDHHGDRAAKKVHDHLPAGSTPARAGPRPQEVAKPGSVGDPRLALESPRTAARKEDQRPWPGSPPPAELGITAPDFKLRATDGRTYGLADVARAARHRGGLHVQSLPLRRRPWWSAWPPMRGRSPLRGSASLHQLSATRDRISRRIRSRQHEGFRGASAAALLPATGDAWWSPAPTRRSARWTASASTPRARSGIVGWLDEGREGPPAGQRAARTPRRRLRLVARHRRRGPEDQSSLDRLLDEVEGTALG